MRTKFKPWAEPYIQDHPEVCFTLEEMQNFKQPFYLEIGSGKGQFLLNMAKKFPHLFFIGVERNVTCAGFTAKKLVEEKIDNAKLMFDNADMILMNLKDESIDGIFLNFSDPWPKKRHAKRRLTAPKYLSEYYRVVKKGGKVYIKTDNDSLYAYTLETLNDSPFKIIINDCDYTDIEQFDTPTEYEESFRKLGQAIHRVVLEKL